MSALPANVRASLREVIRDTRLIHDTPEVLTLARDAVRGGEDELQVLLQSVEELDLPREQQAALGELAAAGLLMVSGFHKNQVMGDLRERMVRLNDEAKASGVLT